MLSVYIKFADDREIKTDETALFYMYLPVANAVFVNVFWLSDVVACITNGSKGFGRSIKILLRQLLNTEYNIIQGIKRDTSFKKKK